jgi:flagellar basal body P-ring protein FlgI
VVVSVLGAAQSLQGGQLLTTPLQYAMFDPQDPATQQIFALAGGRIELLDPEVPTRGVIRGGATIEADFYYSFIEGQSITLVLNDAHASWTWAYVLANSINHAEGEIAMAQRYDRSEPRRVRQVAVAQALGPKNVRVRIPDPELINPAYFISRVLQVELFAPPEPRARVTINRLTKNVSFTGNVTVSPTVLQIPGFGAVSIGQPPDDPLQPAAPAEADESIQFEELFDTLSALKVPPELMIDAIEHLHRTGTLHAELRYVE